MRISDWSSDVCSSDLKRDVYTAGLSYGTESGPGVRLGLERRYVNTRGHKALAQPAYAQQRKTLTLQYRIPAFAWLDGWYTASLPFADEQTPSIDSRRNGCRPVERRVGKEGLKK